MNSRGANQGLIVKVRSIYQDVVRYGPHQGRPAVMMNMAGCSVGCWFCDSDYVNGNRRTVTSLIQEVNDLMWISPAGERPLIVLGGGEPMEQKIGPLVDSLEGNGWHVQIETNGLQWTDVPDSKWVDIICSPKTPEIHCTTKGRATHWVYHVRESDEYDRKDGLPVCNAQNLAGSIEPLAKPVRNGVVYLLPVREKGKTEANMRAAVSRAMYFGHRVVLADVRLGRRPTGVGR